LERILALIVHVEMCGVGMADEVGTCEDGWRVRPKARKEESRTRLGIYRALERLRKRQTGWTWMSSRWNVN
jgi:hypothetical protein